MECIRFKYTGLICGKDLTTQTGAQQKYRLLKATNDNEADAQTAGVDFMYQATDF